MGLVFLGVHWMSDHQSRNESLCSFSVPTVSTHEVQVVDVNKVEPNRGKCQRIFLIVYRFTGQYLPKNESIVLIFGPIYQMGDQALVNKHILIIRILLCDIKSYCLLLKYCHYMDIIQSL